MAASGLEDATAKVETFRLGESMFTSTLKLYTEVHKLISSIYIYLVTPPTTVKTFRMQHSYRIARQEKLKVPESKIPKIHKSKNPKIQNFLHLRNLAKKCIVGFWDIWILEVLAFFGNVGLFDICNVFVVWYFVS